MAFRLEKLMIRNMIKTNYSRKGEDLHDQEIF